MNYNYPLNGEGLSLDKERCMGCGRCLDVCPHAVFARSNESGKASIDRRSACMGCGACALNCPVDAISVDRGVGCAVAIIDKLLGRKGECSCDRNSNCC